MDDGIIHRYEGNSDLRSLSGKSGREGQGLSEQGNLSDLHYWVSKIKNMLD